MHSASLKPVLRLAFGYWLGREKKRYSCLGTYTHIHTYVYLYKYVFQLLFSHFSTYHKIPHKITINNFLEWFFKFYILIYYCEIPKITWRKILKINLFHLECLFVLSDNNTVSPFFPHYVNGILVPFSYSYVLFAK